MTEKRFEFGDSINLVIDNMKNNSYGSYNITYLIKVLNELHEENHKIKSLLLKKVEVLNEDYDKSVRAGMPTGGIIGELDSFEEICRVMGWIE